MKEEEYQMKMKMNISHLEQFFSPQNISLM